MPIVKMDRTQIAMVFAMKMRMIQMNREVMKGLEGNLVIQMSPAEMKGQEGNQRIQMNQEVMKWPEEDQMNV